MNRPFSFSRACFNYWFCLWQQTCIKRLSKSLITKTLMSHVLLTITWQNKQKGNASNREIQQEYFCIFFSISLWLLVVHLDLGASRSNWPDDLVPLAGVCRSSRPYESGGASALRWKSNSKILQSIQNLSGSQWKEGKTGGMWSCVLVSLRRCAQEHIVPTGVYGRQLSHPFIQRIVEA